MYRMFLYDPKTRRIKESKGSEKKKNERSIHKVYVIQERRQRSNREKKEDILKEVLNNV